MEREKLKDKGVNRSIPLPIFQAALIVAGGVTQVLIGIVPGIKELGRYKLPNLRSTGATARNFNNSMGITANVSDETLKLITNFRNGIILATHDNGNMSDFSTPISLLDSSVSGNLRIGSGKTVTPMYGTLLSDAEVFLAEGENRKVLQGINETIESVNYQSKVAFVPYFGELQALHHRIIQGVHATTPVLDIKTTFPFPITYVNGRDGLLGKDTIYGRILRGNAPIEVTVEAEIKTAGDYVKNKT